MLQHLNTIPQSPSRVVLLGGSGFIGKELILKLNNASIPYLQISSSQIDLTKDGSGQSLADLLNADDSVVFLSAITPDKGKGVEAFDKNIRMAVNVAKALEAKPVSHLVYFSSDAIYSMKESVVSESTTPNPDDLYGLMHLTREKLMSQSFANTAIIRPTLVYGLNDTHNSYGPNRLRRMAHEKGEITLFGEGGEKRDHIFVSDLVEILFSTLNMKSVGALNAVTGRSISYLDLANEMASLFDGNIKVVTGVQTQPMTHRHFDNSEVFKCFPEFQFKTLEDGLGIVHKQMTKAAA